MEQYLTTKELSKRIKMAQGTIRNLVWKNELKENIHYVKPTGRKLLFVWSRIESWLHGEVQPGVSKPSKKNNCLINI